MPVASVVIVVLGIGGALLYRVLTDEQTAVSYGNISCMLSTSNTK